jgi:hypothetical protein
VAGGRSANDGRVWPGSGWPDEDSISYSGICAENARELKAKFPMVQVKIYDAVKKTETLIELPDKVTIPIKHATTA